MKSIPDSGFSDMQDSLDEKDDAGLQFNIPYILPRKQYTKKQASFIPGIYPIEVLKNDVMSKNALL